MVIALPGAIESCSLPPQQRRMALHLVMWHFSLQWRTRWRAFFHRRSRSSQGCCQRTACMTLARYVDQILCFSPDTIMHVK